ncbi:unnamed protein product [Onchocerca flexuosa]|uniref:G_PROTEIN_RECEP_F1_2 domain-containing protein n=1 Tax=Onchocerca flexuosa TaxID=387005 RepID=A0A183HS22_9BILA|nr:unnamed protein product [Onchocerca flexuosa]
MAMMLILIVSVRPLVHHPFSAIFDGIVFIRLVMITNMNLRRRKT